MTTPDPIKPAEPTPEQPRTLWDHVSAWDGKFSAFRSLGIVTLAASLCGGYLQYLGAYEKKVSDLAEADTTAATAAILKISSAFAEAQMQQQLIYFNFKDAANAGTDKKGAKEMDTKAAQDAYPGYVKARNELRKNKEVYARTAELYMDWASDRGRDPADTKAIDGDPLTDSALGYFDFDCDAKENFAHYDYTKLDKHVDDDAIERGLCATSKTPANQMVHRSDTVLCKYDDNRKPTDQVVVHWHSAKHHLQVMQYCFQRVHDEIETARTWASDSEITESDRATLLTDPGKHQKSFNNQVRRLDDFMSLAMSQLEGIRVKYRPAGAICHVPVIRELISVASSICMPIRTAVGEQN
jgi:hypothetical protein